MQPAERDVLLKLDADARAWADEILRTRARSHLRRDPRSPRSSRNSRSAPRWSRRSTVAGATRSTGP